MLTSLEGLDHIVVMVKDLDTAAAQWRAIGFTLSPRGTHSAHLGTGNYTMMLGDDYIELLGVLQATELNEASRSFLDRRGEGIERAAFTTNDAAAGVAALQERGIQAKGPIEFNRPVDLPDGRQAAAAFSVFHWPVDLRPADLRIFACQHHTRDTVWIPELQQHENTATAILRIEAIASDPQQAANQMAELIDGTAVATDDGVRVATAADRGEFIFMSKAAFIARHPSTRNSQLPDDGAAAVVIRVKDLDAAARAAGPNAAVDARTVTVPATDASGVVVVFAYD